MKRVPGSRTMCNDNFDGKTRLGTDFYFALNRLVLTNQETFINFFGLFFFCDISKSLFDF